MLAVVPSSCPELAARLGVDKMTAWRWRMRLLEALEGVGGCRPGLPLFSGIVEADGTNVRESRESSREWLNPARVRERHPRPPWPRWQDFRRRGTGLPAGHSRWHIPMLTLADRAGGRHAEMLPDRRAESLIARLETRIRRDAVLCSDGDGAYRLFAQAHGQPHYSLNAQRSPTIIQTAVHIKTLNNRHRAA